jgi:hypothetical protein
MKRANLIATACFTVLTAVLALSGVRAQDTGAAAIEKSILTFSAPVELPKMTLPAGTYVFKRPDANSARIIQVFTEDEKKILGTFLTVPTKRLEVTSENVVTFKEQREGQMPAVHYWYYPARETGHEFVYPKDQAMRIAARTGETVLSTEGEISESASVTPVEGGAQAQVQTAPAAEPAQAASADAAPAAEPAQSASADTTADVNVNRQSSASTASPESTVAQNDAPAANTVSQNEQPNMPRESVGTSGAADQSRATDAAELPQTASPLPLSGLIALLSFGGAAVARRFRQ